MQDDIIDWMNQKGRRIEKDIAKEIKRRSKSGLTSSFVVLSRESLVFLRLWMKHVNSVKSNVVYDRLDRILNLDIKIVDGERNTLSIGGNNGES